MAVRIQPLLGGMSITVDEVGNDFDAVCYLTKEESRDFAVAIATGNPYSIDDATCLTDTRLLSWHPDSRLLLVAELAYTVPAELVSKLAWAISKEKYFSTEVNSDEMS